MEETQSRPVGQCPHCGDTVRDSHLSEVCMNCMKRLPDEIISALPGLAWRATGRSGSSGFSTAGPLITREISIVIGIAGFVLLVLGALRWNSIGSQVARGMGQTDDLGIIMLLGGAAGLIFGGYSFFGSNGADISSLPKSTTVESRLRQLEDLRAKNLITDSQYEQRKQEIISSL